MASFKFKQDFNKGVNLDVDQLKMPASAVAFIKNMTANVNQNPGATAGVGSNMEMWTPLEGNEIIDIGSLPDGYNYCRGFYSSEQTNEGYFFVWNSSNQHTVWVISGDNGSVRKVYQGDLLPFGIEPELFISPGRCTLELKQYTDPVTGEETNFKFLIFTNNTVRQYFVSVEDSIATNSFSTAYFTATSGYYDPATLITLGVPVPLDCISITEVAPEPEDINKPNMLLRNAFQFRVKFVDVYGRESEHGIISSPYLSSVAGGCVSGASGLPRCVDLSFDGGNPLVDYIQIEYRKWVGNDTGSALQTGWVKYDTISKWVHAPGVQWYQRSPNTTYYDIATNKITYRFCGDRNCQPIPDTETSRTEPGVPRLSSSVFSVNKRIALANNVRGFEPLDPAQVNKVAFAPVVPESAPCVPPPMRTIRVYANIWRYFEDQGVSSPFDCTGIIRKSFDKIVWGDEDGDCGGSTANSFKVDQVFADQENPGFIFYLAGTPYSCVARWGSLDLSTQIFRPNPTFATPDPANGIPMCEITLVVPAGKYVLRGASHKTKITDPAYQSTSTYIFGYTTLSAAYAILDRRNAAQNPIKEMVIDCTAGDVIYNNASDPMFVIMDLSGTAAAAIDGYLFEEEGGNTPIEMAPVYFSSPGSPNYANGSYFTDHNGFFFAVGNGNILSELTIAVDTCTDGYKFVSFSYTGNGIVHGYGGGSGAACSGSGNPFNRVYVYNLGSSFPEGGRRKINQNVYLCDTESGVSGTPIVMTKGAVSLTDSEGLASIIAHNRYDYASVPWPSIPPGLLPFLAYLLPDYSSPLYSGDILVPSRYGACALFDCGGCSYDLPTPTVDYIPCGGSRITSMADYFVSAFPVGIKGVQSSGRYGVGFWLHDEIGRHTFFQVRSGEDGFVEMPAFNDTTSPFPAQILCSIGYTIASDFQVPSYFKKMTFGVTENTVTSDFITWRADYVQFVDNTGLTNTVNPTHIRIYYGSLNEYKKLYNNAVNCAWDFLAAGTTSSAIGDTVQFIMNGVPDGSGSYFLPPGISSQIAYDSSGLFFLIDFREELRGLTNGCLFKITRPKSCQTNYLYYEQCLVIDLEDGRVPEDKREGVLPYFDSYLLSRLLPVPILEGQPGALPPGGVPVNPIKYTSTNLNTSLADQGYATSNLNSNGVYVMSVNDAPTASPFYFESPSPSDFWGSHLANRGRVGAANPYEAQQRIGTEVALSSSLLDRGILNGLSYFDDINNVYTFDRNTWGNITAALVEVGKVLFICDSDHFLSNYNQTQLTVSDGDGVSAQNQYGPFTSPMRPAGTPFGCLPKYIPTIAQYLGKVFWLDAEGRLIKNNFSQSVDVSAYNPDKGVMGGYSGYIMNKIARMNVANLSPSTLRYFVGGIDPRTQEYYLTSFQVYDGVQETFYLNNISYIDLNIPETLIIDIETGMLKSLAPFTPEAYGQIPGYFSGRNFFTFRNARPWKHHFGSSAGTPPPFGNFYGTQCPAWVTPIANVESETVKRFLWLEVYTKQNIATGGAPQALFYAPNIVSEKGQVSRLAPERFVLRDGFQAAEFLCNLNTPLDPNKPIATGPQAITDGDPLIGRWLSIDLKTNDLWKGEYFELSATITGLNGIKISGDK